MTKLQITLTDEDQLLSMRAAVLGYDVTKYAKFVLAQDAIEQLATVPTFVATPKMNSSLKKALKDDSLGKSVESKLELFLLNKNHNSFR
ncbi:MAG: hypothetical protein UY36_C0004G0002 [Parcubacteria group bacterium GW2011_GWA1_49_11]|nr:MAG: hypothetical protein UY36_C0004G0002 [Parcubacteria group bacterium GW2011_GWA1_49_11]